MKNAVNHILAAGLILTGCLSCKKPFSANLTGTATGILAVDGPVISGDSTFITLSRTTALNDTTQNKAELGAVLTVENDQGVLYPLVEKGNGLYALGVTNFNIARTYRLDIKTKDGKVYQSDFVPVKVTPPIDSIYYSQTSDATILFYANTHDATNNTRYYRWDYKETWNYTSYYGDSLQNVSDPVVRPFIQFNYIKSNNTLVAQNPEIYVGTCYKTDMSNEIDIASSANISNDIIKGQQIGGIAANSEKIAGIYVMQLHEYALTQAGFNYYQNLKTNTEETGSIFDAQPSVTTGNIHCITTPTERVIGFISMSTVSTRMFITRYNNLPLKVLNFGEVDGIYYTGPPYPTDCMPDNPGFGGSIMIAPAETFNTRLNTLLNVTTPVTAAGLAPNGSLPYQVMITSAIYGTDGNGNQVITGYYYMRSTCLSCLAKEPAGASLTRPSFFPPY